jgi:hypothetical protein
MVPRPLSAAAAPWAVARRPHLAAHPPPAAAAAGVVAAGTEAEAAPRVEAAPGGVCEGVVGALVGPLVPYEGVAALLATQGRTSLGAGCTHRRDQG